MTEMEYKHTFIHEHKSEQKLVRCETSASSCMYVCMFVFCLTLPLRKNLLGLKRQANNYNLFIFFFYDCFYSGVLVFVLYTLYWKQICFYISFLVLDSRKTLWNRADPSTKR